MRFLALARYRFLLTIRSQGMSGSFFGALIFQLLCSLPMIGAWTNLPYPQMIAEIYRESGTNTLFICLVHAWMLLAICFTFGITQKRAGSTSAADMVETAPVSATSVYWGDALGIFAAAASIHLCMLPPLCILAAFSPFSTLVLCVLEAGILLVTFLSSCLAAWSLRAESWRWSIVRIARGSVVVACIFAVLAVICSRNPRLLAEASVQFLTFPGRSSWAEFLAAWINPLAAAVVIALAYLSFIAFFSLHAVRHSARV